MGIQSGSVIRHASFKDVACVVTLVMNNEVLVKWINVGFVSSWHLSRKSWIEILNPKEWEVCVDDNPKCYRYAKWVGL